MKDKSGIKIEVKHEAPTISIQLSFGRAEAIWHHLDILLANYDDGPDLMDFHELLGQAIDEAEK